MFSSPRCTRFLEWAAKGALQIETEPVLLAEIEQVWQRPETGGRRLVVIP
jgi:hypothetical protein